MMENFVKSCEWCNFVGMVDYEIISKIKAALAGKGVSQRELAERIGKDETAVSRWLAGKVGIGARRACGRLNRPWAST